MPFDPAAPPGASDTLSLIVNGQTWTGWQRVSITRAMERMPANFMIQVTEKYPSSADIVFNPGDRCQVMIGSDLVITGYIDRYQAIVVANNHTVSIFGRSLSQDLVDCAAFVAQDPSFQSGVSSESFQIMPATALAIAQQLAQPYNVNIWSSAGPGVQIPRPFRIAPGETVWEIIDRLLRLSQLVAFDMPDGSVQFAQAGSASMASGFQQGVNIEQATVNYSMDQRFQLYEAFVIGTDAFYLGTVQATGAASGGSASDNGVPRFRKRIIISEQSFQGQSIAQARAQWEANRRAARSQSVLIRCDAWRDQAGALWDLNHLAPVNIPAIKINSVNWLIGAITYTRDETGQHALITLMPAGAFQPEPIGDISFVFRGDLGTNNPTATPNPSTPPRPPLPNVPV